MNQTADHFQMTRSSGKSAYIRESRILAPVRPRVQAAGLRCLKAPDCRCFTRPANPRISRYGAFPENPVTQGPIRKSYALYEDGQTKTCSTFQSLRLRPLSYYYYYYYYYHYLYYYYYYYCCCYYYYYYSIIIIIIIIIIINVCLLLS